jgi:hypothetical protein
MRIIFLFILISTAILQQAYAQVINADRNVVSDSLHPHRPKGLLGISASADKQKKNLVDVSTSADFSFFLPAKHVAVLLMRNDLTTNGSDIIQNSGMFHLRFRDNDSRIIYPEAFFQFQWNGVLGMEGRTLMGGNARWKVIHENEHDLFIGLGLMSENESWNFNGVPQDRIPTTKPARVTVHRLRLNHYIKWAWKLSSKTDFVLFNFLQAPSSSVLHPRLASNASVNFNPTSLLGFSIVFDSMYDTRPVVPIDKYYYSLKASINLSF